MLVVPFWLGTLRSNVQFRGYSYVCHILLHTHEKKFHVNAKSETRKKCHWDNFSLKKKREREREQEPKETYRISIFGVDILADSKCQITNGDIRALSGSAEENKQTYFFWRIKGNSRDVTKETTHGNSTK